MSGNKGTRTLAVLVTTTVLALYSNGEVNQEVKNPFSEEFIDHINSVQNSWTAGLNFDPNTPVQHTKNLLGVLKSDTPKARQKRDFALDTKHLPKEFDAREKWKNCPSITEIRDQGSCNNAWAVAAVSVMTDRVCIHSEGKQQFHFSAIDLVSCCELCGLGCVAGNPYQAWRYYLDFGIVSGGNYNSTTGCKPYPFRNCNHNENQTTSNGYPNCDDVTEKDIKCEKQCISKDIHYNDDKRKAKNIYWIDDGEEAIRKEIYLHGPVEATFDVYEDILSYKKGVYIKASGMLLGSHAVKIIGWGAENGHKYWLVANSWNESWGDKGLFKILRGYNHCNIEEDIYAGEPLLST